jgi:hypothetical protein
VRRRIPWWPLLAVGLLTPLAAWPVFWMILIATAVWWGFDAGWEAFTARADAAAAGQPGYGRGLRWAGKGIRAARRMRGTPPPRVMGPGDRVRPPLRLRDALGAAAAVAGRAARDGYREARRRRDQAAAAGSWPPRWRDTFRRGRPRPDWSRPPRPMRRCWRCGVLHARAALEWQGGRLACAGCRDGWIHATAARAAAAGPLPAPAPPAEPASPSGAPPPPASPLPAGTPARPAPAGRAAACPAVTRGEPTDGGSMARFTPAVAPGSALAVPAAADGPGRLSHDRWMEIMGEIIRLGKGRAEIFARAQARLAEMNDGSDQYREGAEFLARHADAHRMLAAGVAAVDAREAPISAATRQIPGGARNRNPTSYHAAHD